MIWLTETAINGMNRVARREIYTYKDVAWNWKTNLDAAANYYSGFYNDPKNRLQGLDRAAFAYKGYHDGNLNGNSAEMMDLYRSKNNAN